MATVVGYARVSTVEQAEQGLSLAAQRQRIAEYCALYSLSLLKTLSDDGKSGKTTANRPKAQEVIQMVRKKEVAGVVVCKLDRFARSTREAIEFADLCRKNSVVLHSISEKIDTSTAMGEFFYTLMAAFAQMESRKIGERTAEVLSLKRERGEKTGGTVPFGYRVKIVGGTKVLVPEGKEQQALRVARARRAKGDSIRQIARTLEKHGFLTKHGKKTWWPSSVHKLLSDDKSVHVGQKVDRQTAKKARKGVA